MNAVIFDMDGVLFDTEALALRAALTASGALGLGLTEEDVLATLGMTEHLTDESYKGVNPQYAPAAFWPRCDTALQEMIASGGVPLKPHVRETVAALRSMGFPLALCSSSPMARIRQYLSLTNLADAFAAVTAGRADVPGKPAPDMYLNTANALGIPPARCLVVEDSPLGLRAARLAGMVTAMVPDLRPYTDDLAPDCDHVLHGLSELPALAESVFACR